MRLLPNVAFGSIMNIRSETPADAAAIDEIHTLAFGHDNEARLVKLIRATPRYTPALSLVAEQNGAVVGHILFSHIDLVGEQVWQVLGLAPLAVHPDFQNQGIGGELVRSGLAIADELGEALVVVLGHEGFYPKFGFEPAIRYGIESPFPVPEAVFMVKPLQYYQEAYRGKVVYPRVFLEV